jgi:endonuclease/exonuclease/phosphatase (EEP) superfamily protein YafD
MLDWGLSDVHEQLGEGWSRSWPANRFFPPFVRIDHALVRNGAAGMAMRDIEVPGSDHRGFVATIAVQAVAANPA